MKNLIIATLTLFTSIAVFAGPACCGAKAAAKSAEKADAKVAAVKANAAVMAKDKECAPGKDCATCPEGAKASCDVNKKSQQAAAEGRIDTDTLQKMIAAKHAMVILDARTAKFDDGKRIPGAKLVGPDLTDAQIAKLIPSKESMVVTYCGGLKCPLGDKLADKLRTQGYKKVVVYKEGISGWVQAGNKAVAN